MKARSLCCERCDSLTPADRLTWRCPACGGTLAWVTERRFDRSRIDQAAIGFWRYRSTLPLDADDAVTLGETTTPLVPLRVDGAALLAKLEFLSPSGSYKDRGAAVLVAALRALGATHAVEDSSGNAAAAISAYAARAGLRCTVYAPAAASPGKLVQSAAYGSAVVRIEGSRDDVATAAMRAAAREPGATYASHNWHPYFIEGVKTWAFEVWEQLGHAAPDAVVVPAGSGSMLLGAHLAFSALVAGGELPRIPRLYAAQPAACAPLVAAMDAGEADTAPFPSRPTIAEGTAIANPVRGRQLLAAMRASGGGAVAVEETAIRDALLLAARQGVYIEPTAAVAIAGFRELRRAGLIAGDERAVAALSGAGLKATDAIRTLVESDPPL